MVSGLDRYGRLFVHGLMSVHVAAHLVRPVPGEIIIAAMNAVQRGTIPANWSIPFLNSPHASSPRSLLYVHRAQTGLVEAAPYLVTHGMKCRV